MSSPKIKFSIGNDKFDSMITSGEVLVDKSLFIKEVLDGGDVATLITKMRRLGKSLNLDMLKTFLNIEVDKLGNPTLQNSNRVLFEGGVWESKISDKKILKKLAIADVDDGYYMNHQGKYPVIFISLQNTQAEDLEATLKIEIEKVFRGFSYLNLSTKLSDNLKARFNKYIEGDINRNELENSLLFLSELLHKHHSAKVYILVDEYDKPINQLFEKDFELKDKETMKEAAGFITSMLSKCGKGNSDLEKIIMIGIYDSLLKEAGSGFNNVRTYTINDVMYSRSFGFSEDEVIKLTTDLNFGDKEKLVLDNLKHWYNGYNVPVSDTASTALYTPWAVLNYLSNAKLNIFTPQNYWTNTGTSSILQRVIKSGAISSDLRTKFSRITTFDEVKLDYEPSISLFKFDFIPEQCPEKIFTYLLVNSGYLTAKHNESGYYFRIPNLELKSEFATVLEKELQDYKAEKDQKSTALATVTDIKIVQLKQDHIDVLNKHIDNIFREELTEKAFVAIKECNYKALKELFENHKITCWGPNFNFFHANAIHGGAEIFDLLSGNCAISARDNDIKFNLKPIDYAFLFKHKDVSLLLEEHTNSNGLSIAKPNSLENVICSDFNPISAIFNTFVTLAVTGLATTLASSLTSRLTNWKAAYLLKIAPAVSLFLLKAATNYYSEDLGWCIAYNKYNQVNDNPTKINSLLAFEKYMLTHDDAYTKLNENCDFGHSEITMLHVPRHQGLAESMTYHLCDVRQDSEYNLSSYLNPITLTAGVAVIGTTMVGLIHHYYNIEHGQADYTGIYNNNS